jgi:hypothetical protein
MKRKDDLKAVFGTAARGVEPVCGPVPPGQQFLPPIE